MNLLTNEILNDYLDDNLDEQKRVEVEKILASSKSDRENFKALKIYSQ